MTSFQETLDRYTTAGARGFWITTHEEPRVIPEILEFAKERGTHLFSWSQASGATDLTDGSDLRNEIEGVVTLVTLVGWLRKVRFAGKKKRPWGIILTNAHAYIDSKEGACMLRFLQEEIYYADSLWFCLSIQHSPPTELWHAVQILPFLLPTSDVLVDGLAEIDLPRETTLQFAEASLGMTVSEARVEVHAALLQCKEYDKALQAVWDSKARAIESRKLARISHPKETLDDVGGCYKFKEWFRARRACFSKAALDLGIAPKGILLVGPYGTGKSLLSRALAGELYQRYIEWDIGMVMDQYVGQTEHATDELLELTLLHSPCVVRIEEVAHQLSGHESSGVTDSGVMARIVGKILTFMEEKAQGIFFVMSTNEPDRLPPAFMRRLDAIWGLQLPGTDELLDILRIHIGRLCPELSEASGIDDLAELMHENRFSGSEARQTLVEAMQTSFPQTPSIQDLKTVARTIIPASKVQQEQSRRIERWAEAKARRA